MALRTENKSPQGRKGNEMETEKMVEMLNEITNNAEKYYADDADNSERIVITDGKHEWTLDDLIDALRDAGEEIEGEFCTKVDSIYRLDEQGYYTPSVSLPYYKAIII